MGRRVAACLSVLDTRMYAAHLFYSYNTQAAMNYWNKERVIALIIIGLLLAVAVLIFGGLE